MTSEEAKNLDWRAAEREFEIQMLTSMAGTEEEQFRAARTIAVIALAKLKTIESCLPSHPMTALNVIGYKP